MSSSLFTDITPFLLDDISRHPSRSVSVYQRKTAESNYVLVPGPRLSRANGSLSHSSISPLPEDAATQGDIFNDSFLRQMNPSTHAPSREPEPEEEERILENKPPVTLNVYEDSFTPENANFPASVYDTVPPPRNASESITSQSSVDSVPAFPPPSSDEAIRTLQNFMLNDHSLRNEGNSPNTRSQHNPAAVYENLDLKSQSEGSSIVRRKDDGVYDNVMIRNVPANLEKTDIPTANTDSEPDRSKENVEGARRLSGVKQSRTRDSMKGGQGSRPPSTLNESYEWSKVNP